MRDISRRQFIELSAVGSLGLILGVPSTAVSRADGKAVSLHPLVRIGSDGKITLFAQNPEMGQGVKTALPMIIAEELDVDWQTITVEQSDWNAELENQFSGGSLSIRLNYSAMRQAGASAREMLLQAAANSWGVSTGDLSTNSGNVLNAKTGQSLSYAELAEDAATVPVPESPALKSVTEFELIGTSMHDVDLPEIVSGEQTYSLDLKLPEMLYAVVKRCPVSDGQPVSFDEKEAREVRGVIGFEVLRNDQYGGRVILPNNPNFVSGVAVLAEHTWAAMQGARRLEVEWELPPNLDDSADLMAKYARALQENGEEIRKDGDVEQAIDAAMATVDEQYRLPFLAHVPMEPMNCTADVGTDRVVVWAPTQNPEYVVQAVAKALDIDADKISVKVMRCGGGFGRRFYADFAVDAAILSQRMKRPVKVVWTREDDVQYDYFRPSSLHRVRAAVDGNGRISGWHHKMVNHSRGPYLERDGSPAEISNYEFPAAFVPNLLYEYMLVPARIPLGQWRAVDHSANVFVVASVIDELAQAAGTDPLAFLRRLIGDEQYVHVREDFRFDASRLLHVVNEAARLADWDRPLPEGQGRGIAASYNQGAWVAEVAEVSVIDNNLTVNRIAAAVDCGMRINPSGARAQVEGGIIEGMSAALMGEINVSEGRVQQNNFHNYPVCRMQQVPTIDVHFVESNDAPRGLGEGPLPPVAPAICNAVFAASGKRIRELPLKKHFAV